MENYILPVETVNKVLEYLSKQPYYQVAHLIEEMHKGQLVNMKTEIEPEPETLIDP